MLLIARAVLRRRWVALVGLGLVAGLAGATVTSAAALARRTGTAYERLEDATAPGDVTMFVLAGDEAAERAAKLPGVEQVWRARAGVAAVGDSTEYLGLTAGPTPPPGLVRPIPIEGRLPDPDAADEVAVHEVVARELRRRGERVVGGQLPLHFLTGDDFRAFDTGFGAPHGPAVEVTIVGIARIAGRPEGLFSVVGGPGFLSAHPDAFIGPALNISLEDGATGVPAYLEELEALESDLEPLEAGAEEFQAFDVEVTGAARDEVAATAGALVTGLVVFAAVAGVVGLLVLGQALARYHAVTSAEQHTESALGLTRAQRAGARALAATTAAGLAAAITIAGAVTVGSRGPIGALTNYEPNPGRSLNVAATALGAALTALAVVAAAGLTAWMAGRARRPARSRGGTGTSRLGGRPGALGVRLALGAGTDDAARPARTGLAGLIVGILGIVGALTFSASLTRLIDTPPRYGWSADFAIVDSRPEIDRQALADPRVAAATRYQNAPGRVVGRDEFIPLVSMEHLRGNAGWWITDGEEPRADDEVAVGLRAADDLDVGVGDSIALELPDGSGSRDVTVVGTGVETPLTNETFGSALLMTPAGLERFADTQPFSETLVRATRRGDVDALVDDYGNRYELTLQARPRQVDNLRQLDRLPTVLGGFLAVVGFAALGNAIVLAVRRRGRDLAVLRVIGYTPRQTAAAVLTMALVSGAFALAVGVPLGIAAGRILWQVVAHGAYVAGDALIPAGWTVAISAGVLIAGVLLAALPARRAATLHPAELLRAE